MNQANIQLATPSIWPWVVMLGAIWLPVVYLLGAQWSLFAEYQYGWAVPFLCVCLAWRKLAWRPSVSVPGWKKTAIGLLASAALLFWVMRILQEADPLWRLASYGMVFAAVTMTLLLIYLNQGMLRVRHFLYPVAFMIIAVPWPTLVEQIIIQTLSRFNAAAVAEVLGFCGVPALLHGNVIQVASGMVGVDEACSGIRSFQATLMIVLFFGEFYGLRTGLRWCLLAAGPGLALAFNFLRTFILVFVAARQGLPAMERWHDPTGVILLLGCFFCIWGLALVFKKKNELLVRDCATAVSVQQIPMLRPLSWAVLTWFILSEVSTEAWFRSHENRSNQAFSWTATWPGDGVDIHTNIIPPLSLQMLRCDQDSSASWSESDGVAWQAFYLRWLPANSFYGRAKVALSKYHYPTTCLPAAGMSLKTTLDPVSLAVRPDFNLNFERYVFDAGGQDVYVFFSQTEDMQSKSYGNLRVTSFDRLRAALAGSRNYGQINLEIALTGPENSTAALQVFGARLPQMIKTQ